MGMPHPFRLAMAAMGRLVTRGSTTLARTARVDSVRLSKYLNYRPALSKRPSKTVAPERFADSRSLLPPET